MLTVLNSHQATHRQTHISHIYFKLYQVLPVSLQLETTAANGDADASKYVHHVIKPKVRYSRCPLKKSHACRTILFFWITRMNTIIEKRFWKQRHNEGDIHKKVSGVCQRKTEREHTVWQAAKTEKRDRKLSNKRVNKQNCEWMGEVPKGRKGSVIKKEPIFTPCGVYFLAMQKASKDKLE